MNKCLDKLDDMEEDIESEQLQECGESCGHFDELNICCWLVTNKGLIGDVQIGDPCHAGLMRNQT